MSELYIKPALEGRRIKVTDYFKVKVRKREMTKEGTVVGCYVNSYWHPYIYKAFHVQFDDGTKDTVWAHNLKLVSNEYSRY